MEEKTSQLDIQDTVPSKGLMTRPAKGQNPGTLSRSGLSRASSSSSHESIGVMVSEHSQGSLKTTENSTSITEVDLGYGTFEVNDDHILKLSKDAEATSTVLHRDTAVAGEATELDQSASGTFQMSGTATLFDQETIHQLKQDPQKQLPGTKRGASLGEPGEVKRMLIHQQC